MARRFARSSGSDSIGVEADVVSVRQRRPAAGTDDPEGLDVDCVIELLVRLPGRPEPTPTQYAGRVPAGCVPEPGGRLPVRVSPSRPSRVTVQWEWVPSREDVAFAAARLRARGLST